MKKPSIPKYYRQRFLLALLEMAGGKLSKMDLQKLLFLAGQEADFGYFDFVPYHYGCYSFQAQSDLELMASRGWLHETEKGVQLRFKAGACLDADKLRDLSKFLSGFRSLRGTKLLAYVYERYPYYAIRSRIADEVLDQSSLNIVKKKKRALTRKDTVLYTIGYEGLSFEAYVNRLIQHDVRLLCDVRKNPLSRKFGFSKGTLSKLLPKMGIDYLHIPELGIRSELRQKLETVDDYNQLFASYRKQLPEQRNSLTELEKLLDHYKRIAITCFEKEHTSCHRHCVSDYLEQEGSLEVCHL